MDNASGSSQEIVLSPSMLQNQDISSYVTAKCHLMLHSAMELINSYSDGLTDIIEDSGECGELPQSGDASDIGGSLSTNERICDKVV
jgi:hypothetical protein